MLLSMSSHAFSEPLTIVTEQYPPYNYEENGVVKGMSTEVVKAVLAELAIDAKIRVYPWARAYEMASSQKNVLIYSISRIPEREPLFQWVGVIAPIRFTVFALKSRQDITINVLDDLRPYTMSLVLDDALEQYFSARGFNKIQKVRSNELAMKMFLAGRSDVWPISHQAGIYLLKKNNWVPNETVKPVFKLEGFSSGDQYMAFSPQTSKKLVGDFKQALKAVKQKGIYKKIISAYE